MMGKLILGEFRKFLKIWSVFMNPHWGLGLSKGRYLKHPMVARLGQAWIESRERP